MWINWFVVSALTHNFVNTFYLSFWTNHVTNFPKVMKLMSSPICHLRFSILSYKPLNLSGNVVSTLNWSRPVLKVKRTFLLYSSMLRGWCFLLGNLVSHVIYLKYTTCFSFIPSFCKSIILITSFQNEVPKYSFVFLFSQW